MEKYLRATGRSEVADLADLYKDELTGDFETYNNPEQYFDEVITNDLDNLESYSMAL